jgi:pilus assembly protein CpaC
MPDSSDRPNRRSLRFPLLLAIWLALFGAFSPTAGAEEARWIDLEVGKSIIWRGDRPIRQVSITDPKVAAAESLSVGRDQYQIRGIAIGTTDLWVWYEDAKERPSTYVVTVHADLSELARKVAATVAGPPPKVYPLKGRIAVEGPVPDVETLERVAAITAVYDPEFLNLLTVVGDHQVQLQVVFAEVSRSVLREMGIDALFTMSDLTLGMEGPSLSTGTFQLAGQAALDRFSIQALVRLMNKHGLSKTLAEPTLVALSGQQAEFHAGGEVPVILVTANNISVEFKDYGIKLVFVPTVLASDLIDLRVYTEVSEVDRTNAVTLSGIDVPGFAVRKTSSHLRVRDGMTFAMAGLLYERSRLTRTEVPFLGRIPIVGALFRSVSHDREEKEIMVFVTPELVRPLAAEERPSPPTASEDNNPNDLELFWLGMDHRLGSKPSSGSMGMKR